MPLSSAELLRKHQIRLRKSLGQNLLLDPNLNRKMAEIAEVGSDDLVIEVGPGLGDLTAVLADRARKVLAVEIDPRLIPPLEERLQDRSNVVIRRADILNHPIEEVIKEFLPGPGRHKMVSNLPFYITSPVIHLFLESPIPFCLVAVLVQKEVAERIVAQPGGRDYSLLSVSCQLYCRCDKVWDVSRCVFRPSPDVDAAVVKMERRKEICVQKEDRAFFFQVARAAFQKRRKMLRNSLSSLIPEGGSDEFEHGLSRIGISSTQRIQELSPEQISEVADVLRRIRRASSAEG